MLTGLSKILLVLGSLLSAMTSDDLAAALAASAFEQRPEPPLGYPEMAHFLASKDLKEKVLPNDNDCLFRAVQTQLLKQGINVGPIEELRAMSADWINEHREQLEMHMAGERPFDEYVMNLRQPHKSFGDYFVMLALSALYHVSFIIYCAKNIGAMALVNIDGDSVSGACNEVTVVYHPSREHYNSADSNLETITPSVETPGSLACAARPAGATEKSRLPAAHGEDNVGVEIDFGFQDDWLPLSSLSYRYRKAIERKARAPQRAQQNEGGDTTYRLIFGDCGEKENAEEGPSKVSCKQKDSASKASFKKKASASRRNHAKGSSKGSSSTATAASHQQHVP